MGPLLSRGGYDGSSGVTSYDYLVAALKQATDDFAVDRIVLTVDSPGGQVSGIDGVLDAIRTAKARKPVSATIEGWGYSAAYWLASQADEIVTTPLSDLGSIGAVIAHVDLSRVYADAGVKVTLIHAGAKKVDGNPYEPLSSRARDDMQERVGELRDRFAADVAKGRGISVSSVLGTEAGDFLAEKAVAIGLADRVASRQSVLTGPPPRSRNGGRARDGAASASVALSLNQRGAVPWSTIADQLNAEANGCARSGGAPATGSQDLSGTPRPEIAGRSNAENGFGGLHERSPDSARNSGVPWSAIADELNAEAGRLAPIHPTKAPNQRGAVSWSTIANQLNAELAASNTGRR
jgi:signal peptide peptidase SppA